MLSRQAERILQAQRGPAIVLRDSALIAERDRSLVVRCVASGLEGAASVVVKRNQGDDARGFTDWASLAFLSTLPEAAGVAPSFYGGDVQERLIVMEDLGGAVSLADLLDDGGATTVATTLEKLVVTMARLVIATSGREETFEKIRAALPGGTALGRRQEAARWLDARGRITAWADALDLPLPRGFDDACAAVAATYAEPGAYLAFSHGDPAPSNNHIASGRVCLVDFEYAGYRHALYDITGWAIVCPLPWAWVDAMDKAFRQVLAASPVARTFAGDDQYREEWATMCAYRALAMISWFSPDLLVADGDWTANWTRRPALISTALRLHATCAGVGALEPLAAFGHGLARALQARWPEHGDGALRWPGVPDAS